MIFKCGRCKEVELIQPEHFVTERVCQLCLKIEMLKECYKILLNSRRNWDGC